MTKPQAKQRIQKLRELINHYRYQYHVLDKQEVSDAANDALKHELYELEQQYPDLITPDSPTQRVGGEPLPKFVKVTHVTPMLSMEDVFTFDELTEWAERLERLHEGKLDFYATLKIDGLAVSLVYEGGRLISAATRGDGRIGEDVTKNVMTIDAVPLVLRVPEGAPRPLIDELQGRIEIRGEVYVPQKAFEKMNRERQARGEELAVNPRNIAAGSIRQLDPKIAAARPLDFFAWRLESDVGLSTHEQGVELLHELGFKTPPGRSTLSVDQVRQYFEEMQKQRSKLGYWIDGVVVRVNDLHAYRELGVVGKTPRGLVAWKFAPEEATTIVESVDWFVGRTGALTPVANVRPTFVAGTTVVHASLHNADEIVRLGLKLGDTVILTKAGDIIPKITKVLTELRTGAEQSIAIPKKCPVCGSSIEKRANEVALFCTNRSCYAQEKEHVLHAVRAFAIDGLGDKIVERLVNAGVVKIAPDVFKLTKNDFLAIEGFAEISSQKLADEVARKKNIALEDFIVALGIRHVGAETAFSLAQSFGSIEKLATASLDDLLGVPDIGQTVAQSIVEYFNDRGREILAAYKDVGVTIKKAKAIKRILDGKKFVVTGTLSSLGREEAKDKIRLLGGSISDAVSKKTDFVVVGENPGLKAAKARELGVPVLSEAEFLAMLG